MKKSFSFFYLLLVVFCAFNSCKNKLDLNAPYREIPNVYAVLNPQDRLHIIRVNKVFLGESDANVMAKVSDSVNYQPGELTITLNRYVNGIQVDACPTCPDTLNRRRTITFHDSLVQTEPGTFSTNQRVYVANADLHQELPVIDPDRNINTNVNWSVYGDYILTIKNNKTGNVFTARSSAIDSVKLTWAPLTEPYYPVKPGSAPDNKNIYVDYSEPNIINTLRFNTNLAKIYQMTMRLHFYEDGANSLHPKYVDYVFANQYEKDKATDKNGFLGTLHSNFRGKDIFSALGVALSKMNLNKSSPKKMYKIQYFIYSSTQEYVDFVEYAKPSLNISQSKPLYSNFDNSAAYGIFTFRSRSSVSKNIANPFISEFQRNISTCDFNFYNFDNSRNNCP